MTGAGISLDDDVTFTHTILVSERESLSALNPLISDSKKYLYDKGFSESEIQTMLKENNVDESSLVPFVISLTESEQYQNSISRNELYSTPTLDWRRVKTCAFKALGADILAGALQSSTKTWTKAVLKRLFKTVAARMFGPVGVTVAVIEFSICYFD